MPGSCIRVDLAGLLQPFDQWCERHGKTRSAALRELVAATVGEPGDCKPAQATPRRASATQEAPRVTVQLLGAQATALRGQAAQAGMRTSAYVAAALAAVQEGRAAIAGKEAIEALAQSNYQLAWVGRNMRELARKFDAGLQPAQEPDGTTLAAVLAQLTTHLARAARVLSHIEQTRCPKRDARAHRRACTARNR
ncbi:MAG TPA: hypothetical protein VED83_04255 [Burkholderiaceae bacterium]|nr:hypothetical protein [Burkholderiaceae bacterium]